MSTSSKARNRNGAGKGDMFRPCDSEKMDCNWPYPERRIKTWPRDKDGNLKE